jgi:hypothetical protein
MPVNVQKCASFINKNFSATGKNGERYGPPNRLLICCFIKKNFSGMEGRSLRACLKDILRPHRSEAERRS